ncbi:toll/interleukin-1 receptor domain-containing protein [Cetobacterium sp.]|uniref:toll/interleukin-1 receptor domain-containing protein n=1 Tax=Cetobacterium sp. TaxID=2071632 RepID=UPI002FCB4FC4
MYYHLYIKLKNKKEIQKWDQSEKNIKEDIICSFIENHEFVINGNFILKEDIAQIEIKKTDIAMENYIRKKLKEYKEEMLDYQEKIRNLYMYDFTDYEYIEKPREITEVEEFKNIFEKNIFDDLLKECKKINLLEKQINQTIEIKRNIKSKKIFISHSAKDFKYAERLIELFQDFGIKKADIICTTISGTKLKVGTENYLEKIKQHIKDCPIFISLFSRNYLVSSMCMCEMGASWITDNRKILVLLPGTEFSKISNTVFAKNHGMGLQDKRDLIELIEIIEEEFMLNEIKYKDKDDKFEKFKKRLNETIEEIKNTTKLNLEYEVEFLRGKSIPKLKIIEILSEKHKISLEKMEIILNNI